MDGAWIAQLVEHSACCPARCSIAGSTLFWASSKTKRIFPLELTWVLTPFPRNSFGWEYKPRSSLRTYAFHHTLKRSWHSSPWRVNAGNKNTPSMHHPRRWNVTTSMIGLKNCQICKNLTLKNGEPQRSSWESRRRRSFLQMIKAVTAWSVQFWTRKNMQKHTYIRTHQPAPKAVYLHIFYKIWNTEIHSLIANNGSKCAKDRHPQLRKICTASLA